ncbi:glycerophosphoryl diester phosphodiesterase [Reinekea blandensis]|uniref:Glycerophosphoryl diester phosphodiesterase n=1 Tax=Reinekea blandensis MED297 TaxID=314283 RepID=A4BJ17_9GAMM|nr:glycerophosphoryl diester phosphodiesterase [Reinekea blandensis]EAR07862.1 Glycerophosphoryl diester phosphodiesterase [Reinekea sp. MED297] [Reinekea blandensis MED297]
MSQPMPALIGHRGLPLLAPENTAASVRCAAEHRISWIEVDVTMAGDGTLVMMHDLTLSRFGQSDRALTELTKAELMQVDAGSWHSKAFAGEPLLLFADFLKLADELALNVNLEIKVHPDLDTEDQVNAVLRTLNDQPLKHSRLLISSFDLSALALLRQCDSAISLGVLFEDLPADIATVVQDIQPQSIHCDQSRLTETQAKAVIGHWPLYCYTVNDTVTFERLLTWGVRGVFCDRAHADDMRALADQHGLPVR